MKNTIICLLSLVTILILTACGGNSSHQPDPEEAPDASAVNGETPADTRITVPSESPIVIPLEAVIYTDNEEALELFLDEMQWNMPDLLQQEVYLVGEEINIDFWFSEAAGEAQMDAARSFAITTFVLRQTHFLGASPYQSLILAHEDVTWTTVSCKVYRGSELIYHDRYDEHDQLIR